MPVEFIDLDAHHEAIRKELDAAISRVIKSGQFILGPEVENFEEEVAAYCGTKFAVGVASGTDALRLALLGAKIGPGDEVITTPFTFVATVEVIVQCGAVPVFVDIDPRTFNIDPGKVGAKVTSRTRAILPVHLYGQPADMKPLLDIARRHGLRVIEDCAQSLGATYRGKKAGAVGDAGCLSFFPSKNLGALGDGGMVVTGNPAIAEAARSLRKHGAGPDYIYEMVGFNSRLDALQAAVLSVKLKHLDAWNESRARTALLYDELLSRIKGVHTTFIQDFGVPSYNYYTIRVNGPGLNRNSLREYLGSRGIRTMVYYPLSLHLQKAYRQLGYKRGDFPESERAQEEVISLPIYPGMPGAKVHEVVGGIAEFVNSRESLSEKRSS